MDRVCSTYKNVENCVTFPSNRVRSRSIFLLNPCKKSFLRVTTLILDVISKTYKRTRVYSMDRRYTTNTNTITRTLLLCTEGCADYGKHCFR